VIIGASVALLAISILDGHEAFALICLAFLIWILFEWILFQRLMFSARRALLDCVRQINDQTDETVTMVADRIYQIMLTGTLPGRTRGYRLLVSDTVPDTFNVIKGRHYKVIDSSGRREFCLDYEVRTPICGKMVFPGIQLEISDHWGFFRTEQFVPVNQKTTVLPFLIRPQTTVSVLKHNNLQRHIGHHRHKSAGVSSELLGIRDYRVGDPPRTIAWKPTARLGKLMTCEFENEVPIRATILVDLAPYQFQGRPGPSPADRAIMSAASIAKLLLADRDPVAAILLREESAMRIGHGAGERQLTKILQYLLAASNPNPSLHHFGVNSLVKIVFENCARRFPRLFDEQFNMQHDDQAMGDACMQYVDRYVVVSNATSISFEQPWIDPGRWRTASHGGTKLLCANLLDARLRANDNELFVLIAPEPINQESLDLIESTVKTVIASRHRVVFVAPTIPSPNNLIYDPVAARILAQENRVDLSNSDSELKWRLGTLGAAFARIEDPSLMQVVATQIELLQSGKSRGRAVGGRG